MDERIPVLFVIEDDPEAGELLEIFFEEVGYEVHVAPSVAAARSLAEDRDPDAVVTDLLLEGGESGLVIAREFRCRYPRVPIVLTSGWPEDEIEAAAASVENVHVMAKPLRLSELRATLESLLAAGPAEADAADPRAVR